MLESFHDGSLALETAQLVAAHLTTCDRCSGQLAELASVDRLVRSVPAPPAPAALRDRLYARIAATTDSAHPSVAGAPARQRQPAPDQKVAVLAPRRRVRPVSALAMGLSVVAIVALVMVAVSSLPLARPTDTRHDTALKSIADTPASLRSTTGRAASARKVSSLSALPRFADWRAAYFGFGHSLHVITADGSLDISAPLPSALVADWTGPLTSGDIAASPDGHVIASIVRGAPTTSGPIALLSLVGGALTTIPVTARELYWSPTSDRLAVNLGDERQPRVAVIRLSDGSVTNLSSQVDGAPVSAGAILGWIDATHLAVVYSPPAIMRPAHAATPTASATTTAGVSYVGALDADTGVIRPVAALPAESKGAYLTPSGAEALVTPSATTPAEVIDMTSGTVKPLPGITRRLATVAAQSVATSDSQKNEWASAAWQSTTDQVAISLASSAGDAHATTLWLLDPAHDAAVPLGADRTPLAWTPDGRTLLLAGSPASGLTPNFTGVTQPTLYAVAPSESGVSEKLLTANMALFLGLVRMA